MSSHSPFIFLFFQPFNELPYPHFFHTFLIFQSSSIPPFSFSYFSFTISAFSYFAVVGKGGNRAKRPLGLGIGLGLAPIVTPTPPTFLPFRAISAVSYFSAFQSCPIFIFLLFRFRKNGNRAERFLGVLLGSGLV